MASRSCRLNVISAFRFNGERLLILGRGEGGLVRSRSRLLCLPRGDVDGLGGLTAVLESDARLAPFPNDARLGNAATIV
jgi:hypothetical protein